MLLSTDDSNACPDYYLLKIAIYHFYTMSTLLSTEDNTTHVHTTIC